MNHLLVYRVARVMKKSPDLGRILNSLEREGYEIVFERLAQ